MGAERGAGGAEVAPPRLLVGAKGVLYILLAIALGLIALAEFAVAFVTPGLEVFGGTFMSPIIMVIIIEILARVSRAVRAISPALLTLVLLYPFCIYGGKVWWLSGGPELAIQTTLCAIYGMFGMYSIDPDAYKTIIQFVPSYVLPHDFDALEAFWTGTPTINWGVFIGPIIVWSLMFYISYLMNMFWGMGFLGPYWDEVERLPFPVALPTIYIARESCGNRNLTTGRSRLFDLSNPRSKAFWISFVVGFVAASPWLVTLFYPIELPEWIGGVGGVSFFLPTWWNYLLPGADFCGIICPAMIILGILVPYDLLFSLWGTWFFFSVIFDAIMVHMGLIPYEPGETCEYYGSMGPFPWIAVALLGWGPAYGAYLIWRMRDRIKRLFRGEVTIQGVSGRVFAWGFLITLLLLIILGSALLGVHPLIAIVIMIFTLTNYTAMARAWAEYYVFGPSAIWDVPLLTHSIGQAIGIYQPVPVQQNKFIVGEALFNQTVGVRCWYTGFNNTSIGIQNMTISYKVFKESGANFKDVLILVGILGAVFIPLTLFTMTYVSAHVGGANTPNAWWAEDLTWLITAQGITEYEFSTVDTNPWGYFAAGAAIMLAVCILRDLFPWFPVNPTGMLLVLDSPPDTNWSAFFAIPIKFVLTRALGPKRTEEYVVPILAGFCFGANLPNFIKHIFLIWTVGLPTLAALWR